MTMIVVRVLDSAGNVFARCDVADNDEALALVAEWVLDGFRVEVVPVVPLATYSRLIQP